MEKKGKEGRRLKRGEKGRRENEGEGRKETVYKRR
jgi:hypothetical protein